tara:strand:- start:766 stop:2262 length:1497 start_codon:yes stop_codon:yes gene_type:complete
MNIELYNILKWIIPICIFIIQLIILYFYRSKFKITNWKYYLLGFGFLSLYFICPYILSILITNIIVDPSIQKYDSYIFCTTAQYNNNKNIDILTPTTKRGALISMLLAGSAIIQAILKYAGASEEVLLILYGFITAAVIGFLGDQSFGTNEGYSLYNYANSTLDSININIKYTLGQLTANSFWRYIVTVLLDMFISSPLISIIFAVSKPILIQLDTAKKMMPFKILQQLIDTLIFNFDNVLQSFVAIITFYAYTNDTRFRWAYPSPTLNPNELINGDIMKLITIISGLVFLIATYNNELESTDTIFEKIISGTPMGDTMTRKLIYIILTIIIILCSTEQLGSLYNWVSTDDKPSPITTDINETNNTNSTLKLILNKNTEFNKLSDDDKNTIIKLFKLSPKYHSIENWKYGLITLYGFMIIGFVIPFIKIVYPNNQLKNYNPYMSIYMFIFVTVFSISIGSFLYFYKLPLNETIENEYNNELNNYNKCNPSTSSSIPAK